jgi:hypothetical protein
MLNAKKLLCVLLSGLALVWMTPRACGATFGSGRLRSLSGTYEFQGNLRNVDGRPVAISGNLDFDWLGDISGEALASLGRRHSPDANCNLLVMGNYAPDQQTYLATLTLTPVTTGCPFRHDETLEVRITPGDAEGTLYLNQISPGHHELSGPCRAMRSDEQRPDHGPAADALRGGAAQPAPYWQTVGSRSGTAARA